MLNAYRAFVQWRRTQPALKSGSIRLADSPDGSLFLIREHAGQTLLACFNFGAAACAVRIPDARHVEPLSGHGFAACEYAAGVVKVPAYGAGFAILHNGHAAGA